MIKELQEEMEQKERKAFAEHAETTSIDFKYDGKEETQDKIIKYLESKEDVYWWEFDYENNMVFIRWNL